MDITLDKYKGTNIEKGFQNNLQEQKAGFDISNLDSIEKALESNLEKGLIDEDLYTKAKKELDILKGVGSNEGESNQKEETKTEQSGESSSNESSEDANDVK